MSRQIPFWNAHHKANNHKIKLQRKTQKVDMLKALLEMHESTPHHDHAYILHLRAKLRSAQHQLEAMLP